MTHLEFLAGITALFVGGAALKEWVLRRLWRKGKAAGCTCPERKMPRQDCLLHGWPKPYRQKQRHVAVTRREGGVVNLTIDDEGYVTWTDAPEQDAT